LGKFTGAGAVVEFINRLLGEILPSGDVDGLEPALFAPAPGSACCHADLFQPSPIFRFHLALQLKLA
jgi:hypothetical protein